jgi:RND family efflux transporter MFP subunit
LSEYRRFVELRKKPGVITQTEFDRKHQVALKAQADLRTAEEDLRIGEVGAREEDIRAKQSDIRSLTAAVARAEDRLGYTYLKAPYDGVVAATYVENFETVQAQQQILRLLDTSQIEMVIDIPEGLISATQYVQNITCVFDAFPDTKIEGVEVKEIGTEASDTTRTYPVTLIMAQPDPSTGVKILPGMAGRVSGKAELPDKAEQEGFAVPEAAVFSGEDAQQCVWVIDESTNTVRRQPIKQVRLTSLGMRIQGVQPGQWVATAGVHNLQEGQQVKILSNSGAETP